MRAEPHIGQYRIGDWDFSPATGELRRRSDVRRLEPRAAKALELLCEADGEVVTHDRLIESVWGGRRLSDNSVAVVIGQLRRALEDDAREPKVIETIPKRGYRLVGINDALPRRAKPRLLALLLAVFVVAVTLALLMSGPSRPEVAMADVVNETGNAEYDPLARATSELIVTELGKRGFAVRRDDAGTLRLAAKLVMWNGGPYLGLTAADEKGVVRWSAMMPGTPDVVPRNVSAKLDEFKQSVAND